MAIPPRRILGMPPLVAGIAAVCIIAGVAFDAKRLGMFIACGLLLQGWVLTAWFALQSRRQA